MKDNIDFETAPVLVRQIYVASMYKIPIGSALFEEAITKHPEQFAEREKALEKIRPERQIREKELHDKHFKKYGL